MIRKLVIGLVVLIAVLAVAYFVITSSGFLKSVVLPRVSSALNARIEAESIALHPFSSLEIRKLSVVPNGAEPLAAVESVLVRYQLFAILGGRLAIDEILVASPNVTLVSKPDGSSNLDPILKKLAEGADRNKPATTTSTKPIQLDLRSLKIQNASLRYRAQAKDGTDTTAEVTGLALTVNGLKNGGDGRVEIGASAKFDQRGGPAGGVTGASAQGQVQGAFDLGLTTELMPSKLTGRAEAQLRQASGTLADFQGFSTVLTADLSPQELKRLGLEFARQGTPLGSISASGPLDLAKKEAQVRVEIAAIDRNVLNLFGAPMGLDFTTTRFDSTNRIDLTAGGQQIAVSGSLRGTQFAVKKGAQTMPPLDLTKSYDVVVDLTGQKATVRAFSLQGSQGGREVLRGSLSQPMQVSWAKEGSQIPDAGVQVSLADLRLSDWSALAGTPLQGTVNLSATVGVKSGGRDVSLAATTTLAGMSGTFGSNEIKNLSFNTGVDLALANFVDPAKRQLKGNLKLERLGGTVGPLRFDQYGLDASAVLGLPQDAVAFDELILRARQAAQEGGSIAVHGRWETARKQGELQITAKDINEAAVRPFLQAALGDKQLQSVKLGATASLKLNPEGDNSVTATADLKDLRVNDPSGTVPASPLAAGLSLDASGSRTRLALRQADLKLTPTARAQNQLHLTGDLDFAKADALKGSFKASSESLDITPYFDLFASDTKAAKPGETPATPVPASPPPSGPKEEPAAVHFPVDLVTFDLNVGKFFLREVAAENLVAGIKVTGGGLEVEPFQMVLNGAPVKAGVKLNLGVPGFEYDAHLTADRVPVKPFANSFVPLLKNRIEGNANANFQVKGAGLTGVNLKKHLAGGLGLSLTNANLKLVDTQARKGLLTILTGLLANALNIRELQDQPIMDILARVDLGEGKIALNDALVRSSSFEANTKGVIPIADDLMQSPLDFPVNVAIRRDLAEHARLVSADTPTNATYAAIPPIAAVKGTLGAPAPQVDKVQAGLLAARGITGLIGGKGTNTVTAVSDLLGGLSKGGTNTITNLIQGIGGLLRGGKGPTATNANTPNPKASAPPANPPAAKPPTTNAPVKDPQGGLSKGVQNRK